MLSFLAGVGSTVNQTGANKKKKRRNKRKEAPKNDNLLESINFSEIQETSKDNGSGLGVLQDYDLPNTSFNDNDDNQDSSSNNIILPTIEDEPEESQTIEQLEKKFFELSNRKRTNTAMDQHNLASFVPEDPDEVDDLDFTPLKTPSKPMAPNSNSTVKKRNFENSQKKGNGQIVTSFNPSSNVTKNEGSIMINHSFGPSLV